MFLRERWGFQPQQDLWSSMFPDGRNTIPPHSPPLHIFFSCVTGVCGISNEHSAKTFLFWAVFVQLAWNCKKSEKVPKTPQSIPFHTGPKNLALNTSRIAKAPINFLKTDFLVEVHNFGEKKELPLAVLDIAIRTQCSSVIAFDQICQLGEVTFLEGLSGLEQNQ